MIVAAPKPPTALVQATMLECITVHAVYMTQAQVAVRDSQNQALLLATTACRASEAQSCQSRKSRRPHMRQERMPKSLTLWKKLNFHYEFQL